MADEVVQVKYTLVADQYLAEQKRMARSITATSKRLLDQVNVQKHYIQGLKAMHKEALKANTGLKKRIKNHVHLRNETRKLNATIRQLGHALGKAEGKIARQSVRLKDVAKKTKDAESRTKELVLSWKSIGRLVGVQLFHRAVSLLSRAISDSVASSLQLQLRLAEIRVIAQDNQLTFGGWASELRKVSDSYGIPIIEQAEAAYQTLSNQVAKGTDVMRFNTAANELAIVTASTSAEAVAALSSVMKSYNIDISDISVVQAELAKLVELGRLRLSEIGDTIGTVTPLAAQLGVKFSELSGFVAAVGTRGTPVKKVLTQFRGIMAKLINPTDEMGVFLSRIGVESTKSAIATHRLGGFFKLLKEHVGGSEEKMQKMIPRMRGLTGFMAALTSAFDDLQNNIKKTEDAQESFATGLKESLDVPARQLKIQANKIKNIFTLDIGFSIIEAVHKAGVAMGGFDVAAKALVATLKYVLLPVLGGVALGFAGLALTNPFTGAIAAAAALATALTFTVVAHQEAQARILAEADKFWADRVKADREGVAKSIRVIKEGLEKSLRVHRLQSANIVKELNVIVDAYAKSYGRIGREVKAANVEITNAIKEQVKEGKKNLSELEDAAEKLLGFIHKINMSEKERKLQAKLDIVDEKDPADQLRILRKEAFRLTKSASLEQDPKKADETIEKLKLAERLILRAKKVQDSQVDREKEILRLKIEQTELAVKADKVERKIQKSTDGSEKEALIVERDNIIAEKRIIDETIVTKEAQLANLKTIRRDFSVELGKLRTVSVRITEALRARAKAQAEAQKLKDEEIKTAKAELLAAQTAYKNIDTAKGLTLKTREELVGAQSESVTALKELIKAQEKVQALTPELSGVDSAAENLREQLKLLQDAFDAALTRAGEYKTLADKESTVADITKRLLEKQKELNALNKKVERHTELQLRPLKDALDEAGRRDERSTSFLDSPADRALFGERDPDNISRQRVLAEFEAPRLPPDYLEAFQELKERQRVASEELSNLKEIAKSTIAAAERNLKDLEKSTSLTKDSAKDISESAGSLSGALKTLAKAIIAKPATLVKKASGGQIFGTDSIPALLSPGEFVMNAGATRKFFGQLTAMNSGVQRFAQGGPVTNVTGDMNVSVNSSGNESIDVQRIGNLLRREIRRGTLALA